MPPYGHGQNRTQRPSSGRVEVEPGRGLDRHLEDAALPAEVEVREHDDRPLQPLRLVPGEDGDRVLRAGRGLLAGLVVGAERREVGDEAEHRRGAPLRLAELLVGRGLRAERLEVGEALRRLGPGADELGDARGAQREVEGLRRREPLGGGDRLPQAGDARIVLEGEGRGRSALALLLGRRGRGAPGGDLEEPARQPAVGIGGRRAAEPRHLERGDAVARIGEERERRAREHALRRERHAGERDLGRDAAGAERRRDLLAAAVGAGEDGDVAVASPGGPPPPRRCRARGRAAASRGARRRRRRGRWARWRSPSCRSARPSPRSSASTRTRPARASRGCSGRAGTIRTCSGGKPCGASARAKSSEVIATRSGRERQDLPRMSGARPPSAACVAAVISSGSVPWKREDRLLPVAHPDGPARRAPRARSPPRAAAARCPGTRPRARGRAGRGARPAPRAGRAPRGPARACPRSPPRRRPSSRRRRRPSASPARAKRVACIPSTSSWNPAQATCCVASSTNSPGPGRRASSCPPAGRAGTGSSRRACGRGRGRRRAGARRRRGSFEACCSVSRGQLLELGVERAQRLLELLRGTSRRRWSASRAAPGGPPGSTPPTARARPGPCRSRAPRPRSRGGSPSSPRPRGGARARSSSPSRPASTDASATSKSRCRSVSGIGSSQGESPASSANSRRSRWHTEWIVPM